MAETQATSAGGEEALRQSIWKYQVDQRNQKATFEERWGEDFWILLFVGTCITLAFLYAAYKD